MCLCLINDVIVTILGAILLCHTARVLNSHSQLRTVCESLDLSLYFIPLTSFLSPSYIRSSCCHAVEIALIVRTSSIDRALSPYSHLMLSPHSEIEVRAKKEQEEANGLIDEHLLFAQLDYSDNEGDNAN